MAIYSDTVSSEKGSGDLMYIAYSLSGYIEQIKLQICVFIFQGQPHLFPVRSDH